MLHYAAYNEHNNIIKYLLGIGVDPNLQDKVQAFVGLNFKTLKNVFIIMFLGY